MTEAHAPAGCNPPVEVVRRLRQMEKSVGATRLQKLMEDFFLSLEGSEKMLSESMACNDFEKISRVVHNLRGILGQVGFYDLVEFMREMEGHLRIREEKWVREHLPALIQTLRQVPGQIKPHLTLEGRSEGSG